MCTFFLKCAIILPFVSCGCEIWSVTLREEHRLRVFRNSLWRKILVPGAKREEISRNLSKLLEELRDFYSSLNVIRLIKSRRNRWAGCAARMGGRRVLVGRPEGKRPHGRPRRR
jgi:hypothetical protein